MKKTLITMVFALVSLFSLNLSATAQDKEAVNVAIVQLVSHSSLDDIRQGIYDGLAEQGYKEGENLTVDYQNAEGDLNLLSTIAQNVVAEQPDVIFAITTPVAQAFQNVTQDIPVVMAGVTDPVSAGLIEDLQVPNENITGVSDAVSYEEQFNLLASLVPDAKKVGMIYTTSEDNSLAETESAKEAGENLGYEIEIAGISGTMDMQLVAQDLASKVDAIYVGSDNTIASAFETLLDATDAAGIPVITTVDVMVGQGALSAVAINQKDIGVEAAKVGADILSGKEPKEIPVQFLKDLQAVVNFDTADRLQITIADDVKGTIQDIKERLAGE